MANQKTWEVWGRGFISMSATQIGRCATNLHTNVRHQSPNVSRDNWKKASVCLLLLESQQTCPNQVNISACTDHFAISNNIHLKDYFVRKTVIYMNKLYLGS